MKLYLSCNIPTEDKTYIDVGFKKNVDYISEDHQCDEILCNGILNYFKIDEIPNFILHLLGKLKTGGKIAITGDDYLEICKMSIRHELNISDWNKMVYGANQSRPKESSITLPFLCKILQEKNIKIMMKRLNGYEFHIEGVKQ